MAAEIGVIKTTMPTDGSSVDYEITGFGTPDAVIVMFTTAAASNDVKSISIGYYDGTRQFTVGASEKTGLSSVTDTYRISKTGSIVCYAADGSWNTGVVTGWATNGVTIDWATASTAYDVEITLIKGCTNVHANETSISTSGFNVTNPGFKPDFVFMAGIGNANPSSGAISILSCGVAHNDSTDTVTQGEFSIAAPDAVGTTANTCIVRDNAICGQVYNGAEQYYGYLSGFDSQGFTITASANPGTDEFIYLALELPDPDDAHIQLFTSPTSATTKALTGFGFEPTAVGVLTSHNASLNTLNTTTAHSYMVGVGNTTQEASIDISSEDNVSTTNVAARATAQLINLHSDDGTSTHDATIDSFDSDGVTLDFTTSEATARQFIIWGIGDSTAGGSANIPAISKYYSQMTRQ